MGGDGLQPGAQGLEPAHAAASPLSAPRRPAVAEAHHALGRGGHVLLVGDEHDGAPGPVQLVQQRQHVGARARVQVAGGLVGQEQVGLGHQRTGHRHPLLLAAGQLGGPVVDPVGQAHVVEGCHGPRLAVLAVHAGVDSGSSTLRQALSVAAAGGTAGTRSRCGGCARAASCSSSIVAHVRRRPAGSGPRWDVQAARACASTSTCPSPTAPRWRCTRPGRPTPIPPAGRAPAPSRCRRSSIRRSAGRWDVWRPTPEGPAGRAFSSSSSSSSWSPGGAHVHDFSHRGHRRRRVKKAPPPPPPKPPPPKPTAAEAARSLGRWRRCRSCPRKCSSTGRRSPLPGPT